MLSHGALLEAVLPAQSWSWPMATAPMCMVAMAALSVPALMVSPGFHAVPEPPAQLLQ
jgi:hypothetical protein